MNSFVDSIPTGISPLARRKKVRREPKFYLGLDLGQAQDYTAIAVLERVESPIGGPDTVMGSERRRARW